MTSKESAGVRVTGVLLALVLLVELAAAGIFLRYLTAKKEEPAASKPPEVLTPVPEPEPQPSRSRSRIPSRRPCSRSGRR